MRYGKFARAAIAGSLLVLLPIATTSAAVKTEVVKYAQGDTPLQGFLAYDDAGGDKRPAVLIVPEWWGLNDYARSRAEQLARMGYVAFAADMYGNGQTTNDMQEAGKLAGALKSNRALMRERVRAGLDTLKKNPRVDAQRVAAIGYCFGGTTVLELARSGAAVAGVVSFHGGLDSPNPADGKNIKAKVLVCHGGDDGFISPEDMAAFQKEMRDNHVDWEMNIYGGAVHAFTNPDADKVGAKGIAYNAEADRRSWQAMKDFFDEIFGRAPGGRGGRDPRAAGPSGTRTQGR